jgi:hypothetical protein
MNDGRRVIGLAVFQCGLEANLFGGAYSRIVQTVSQSANDFQDTKFAGSFQDDFEEYFALDALAASFIGIDGNRLGKDFRRN